MKLLGNIIWFLLGGILVAIEYFVASLIMFITIIGIPFGFQTMKLAGVALWPFNKKVIMTEKATGCLAIIMNIIWLVVGGVWIALTHLIFALIFYITIIGIPFGNQHMKLAGLALTPFGRKIINDN
ncbi:uncharacterized membrane protein YccF (DUF307 family) [Balneicella halophila]|uniref:Uncharacterized membrane protein YccF (DUF307 family) n=1 Tax=Balneicella halophila TaxID=1537566 RepID=A0A7L4UPX2_BALHA|nr:YccF domain-containing protein [Balneicella halophila]PVX50856.1 uncharacterized membrane protein YccF (DUF307 family) [Balneicella halophila]